MFKYPRFLIIMPGRKKYIKIYWSLPKLRYPKSKPYRKREAQKKRQKLNKIFSIFHYWRIGLISGLMVLITIWLWNGLTKEFAILPESHHHVPDYTLSDFKTIRMDEQGQLKTQLQAKTMMHFPNAKTELTTPSMVFYTEKKPTWIANAEKGEISPDGNQVWLLGHTTLQQYTQTQQEPMKIISRDVLVQLDTEYAETFAPSSIIKHNDKTDSVGMRIFMPSEKVELLSQVRGYYVLP